jgi:uncharacterized protein YegP (UPF0339 family)
LLQCRQIVDHGDRGHADDHDRAAAREGVPVKFQIKKTSNNQYRFNIVASNGQVLATSETYVQKASAVSTIESIKKNVAGATTEDLSDK